MICKYFKKNNTLLIFSGECFDLAEHDSIMKAMDNYKSKVGLGLLVDLSNVRGFCSQSTGLVLRLHQFSEDCNYSFSIRNPSKDVERSLFILRINDFVRITRCGCSEYLEICDACCGRETLPDKIEQDVTKNTMAAGYLTTPEQILLSGISQVVPKEIVVDTKAVRCPGCGGLKVLQFEGQSDGKQRYLCQDKTCKKKTFTLSFDNKDLPQEICEQA
ncbi:MAG: hypothetical protein HQL64_12225 [Magnetococcales bacterium]|nr:hypothetical protein [Magnetococcales bacterium]